MNENEFVKRLIPSFSDHFDVRTEVWSKCRTGRIDLVLKLNNDVYFGVECKVPNSKQGDKIGEFVKQAIRYKSLEFEVETGIFKRIPIFICPPLSYKYFLLNEHTKVMEGVHSHNKKWHQDRHNENHEHHSFNGFLGAFGIGEIRKSNYSFDYATFFYMSVSNRTIYSAKKDRWGVVDGLNEKNYIKLLKKLGI